jgi:hypothetical protein
MMKCFGNGFLTAIFTRRQMCMIAESPNMQQVLMHCLRLKELKRKCSSLRKIFGNIDAEFNNKKKLFRDEEFFFAFNFLSTEKK